MRPLLNTDWELVYRRTSATTEEMLTVRIAMFVHCPGTIAQSDAMLQKLA